MFMKTYGIEIIEKDGKRYFLSLSMTELSVSVLEFKQA